MKLCLSIKQIAAELETMSEHFDARHEDAKPELSDVQRIAQLVLELARHVREQDEEIQLIRSSAH